jgi:hypothetical protein
MPYLDHSAQVVLVVVPFALLFTAAIVITVLWASFQARFKSIDVLKAYAERGEEPPASVLEAVERINRPGVPLKPPTRGEHLTHLAGSIVLAIGLAGAAWWLSPMNASPSVLGGWGRPSMILAALGAIFFAGSAAARLVAALVTRD